MATLEEQRKNYKKIAECASMGIKDINNYRRRKGIYMGQDPAVAHMQFILNPWGEYDTVQSEACYTMGNWSDWSAAKATGLSKAKLTKEGNERGLEIYSAKDKEIKACKKVFKDVCERKLPVPRNDQL